MAPLYIAAVLLFALAAAPSEARLLRAGGEAVAGRRATTSHPVEGVIALLKRLGGSVDEEGKAEATTYQTFQHWCARSDKALGEAIEEEKSNLESLADIIEARGLTIDTHRRDISDINKEIAAISTATTKADDLRTKGNTIYQDKDTSLGATIDALGSAITGLTYTRENPGQNNLIQSSMVKVIALAGSHLSASQFGLLQKAAAGANPPQVRPTLEAKGDYEAHVDEYAFKSDSVIELLKSLKLKFVADRVKHNQEETNAVNAYNLASAARVDSEATLRSAANVKQTAMDDAIGEKADAVTSQTATQSDLDADLASRKSSTKACDEKSAEWIERSKIRAGESEAIQAAISILGQVTGVRTSPPQNAALPVSPVLLEDGSGGPIQFLQMPDNPEVKKALELLRQEARISHSQAIAQLASALAARTEGPFDQVMNSIEKMVFRLQNEQREEDDHKNWCDLELSKTDASIIDKDDKLGALLAKINVAKSRVGRLANEIIQADNMVGTITEHMKESTGIRKTGREQNNLAIKDSEDAQTAVTQAIAVLTTFYKSSGAIPKESWEFIQKAPVDLKPQPATWAGRYVDGANPLGDPTDSGNQGIITLLKSVSADFARMETDTIAQEESDQNAYDQDMSNCKIEKARRSEESEGKSQEKKRVVEKQASLEKTHKEVTHEKDATVQYRTDLQPACVTADSTYENRKAARATEIEALKMAKGHLHEAFDNITDNRTAEQQSAQESQARAFR